MWRRSLGERGSWENMIRWIEVVDLKRREYGINWLYLMLLRRQGQEIVVEWMDGLASSLSTPLFCLYFLRIGSEMLRLCLCLSSCV